LFSFNVIGGGMNEELLNFCYKHSDAQWIHFFNFDLFAFNFF